MARISYRDFVPRPVSGGMLDYPECELFDTAVATANAWVEQHRVQVLNVETVVLPGIEGRQGTSQTVCRAELPVYQFVRVWYQAEPYQVAADGPATSIA